GPERRLGPGQGDLHGVRQPLAAGRGLRGEMKPSGRPSRSREEFDHFVVDSVDGLLRAAYLIVWDFAEAEDLVQECLFRVARRWERVSGMEVPLAYARRVLVNLALDD